MASYDLVITGGRVIDPETNLDAIRNVGIKGGKIAAVTEKAIEGKETIDASGHVVAPGFIDMHFHNVGYPFGVKLALRDGVTTPLELELGVYPVDEWYASQEGKSQSNYGASVTSIGIRERLHNPSFKETFCGEMLLDIMADPKDSKTSMKWSTEHSTPEQIEKFGEMLDEGLSQGSIGVGHAVGYMVRRVFAGRIDALSADGRQVWRCGVRPRTVLRSDAADQRHPRFSRNDGTPGGLRRRARLPTHDGAGAQ